MMKKRFVSLLLVLMILMTFGACARLDGSIVQEPQDVNNTYYPDNEIITIEDLEDERMVIVIDTQYNVSAVNIEQAVETQFPEVNVVLRLQNTPDSAYQIKKSLEHGQLGDIVFGITGFSKDGEMLSKYFIDLSNAQFINNYYQNALDGVAVNGKIYMLPGFSDIFGIVYDRTLFEEQGWELPQSRDEFIALCQNIREANGYQPFLPTLRFGRMAMLISHAFCYDSVIAGNENQKWLQEYRAGEESFMEHMEPMFEGMKELYEFGVLSEESFEIEAGVRSAMLYKEHTTAMTMENQNASTYALNANSDHEFGMMPFWNGNDADSDYVVSSPGFNIYANKSLEAPENEEKRDKVMEILGYFSTPEGQRALMSDDSSTISNVKGMDITFGGEFMSGVAGTIEKGNIFHEVRYTNLANNNPFQVAFREALIGYITGTMNMNEAMEHCDEGMEVARNSAEPVETVYGTAVENFTVLETAEFVADVLREKANADIALVLANQLAYGEAGNFYEGGITDTMLNYVTLDYVSDRNPEYNKLVTVELTGAQILEILDYPYLNNIVSGEFHMPAKDTSPDLWVKSGKFSYWVPSGIRLEYAPRLTQNAVRSITNMDGSTFDMERIYKVAVWNGCFSNLPVTEYFNPDTLAALADVIAVSDASSVELIRSAIEEAGEISPPDDGRFTILWDVKPKTATEDVTGNE